MSSRYNFSDNFSTSFLGGYLKGLMSYKPDHVNIYHFLDTIFGVEYIDFEKYKVKAAFTMPGQFAVLADRYSEYSSQRDMKRGDLIIARIDKRPDSFVTISHISGTKEKEHVFMLSNLEWAETKLYLAKLPFLEKK